MVENHPEFNDQDPSLIPATPETRLAFVDVINDAFREARGDPAYDSSSLRPDVIEKIYFSSDDKTQLLAIDHKQAVSFRFSDGKEIEYLFLTMHDVSNLEDNTLTESVLRLGCTVYFVEGGLIFDYREQLAPINEGMRQEWQKAKLSDMGVALFYMKLGVALIGDHVSQLDRLEEYGEDQELKQDLGLDEPTEEKLLQLIDLIKTLPRHPRT